MGVVAIVTGGRDHHPAPLLMLQAFVEHGVTSVFVGDATGVDRVAYVMAMALRDLRQMSCVSLHTALWEQEGKSAGPRRNKRMVQAAVKHAEAHKDTLVCLAFPGGQGTADCARRCEAAGIEVVRVRPPFEVANLDIHRVFGVLAALDIEEVTE